MPLGNSPARPSWRVEVGHPFDSDGSLNATAVTLDA
jgi:hypothetical protein